MARHMSFTGYRTAGRMLVSHGLCAGLLSLSILVPFERSEAFDSGGTRDDACFHFYLSTPSVTSTRTVSTTRTEYYLSGMGRAGKSGCRTWMGAYTMRVAASWDASSHTASEQIEHGEKSSTKYIVTHIQSRCDKDPWMYYASCSLISAGTTPGSDVSGLTFEAPYPVSAAGLSKAQKDTLARNVTPYQDFKLAPTTPPVIESPVKDGIYRNNAPVNVNIHRPADGNERWYAEHPLEFDVQFEVQQSAAPAKDAMAKSSFGGTMWTSVSPTLLLGRMTLTTTPTSVPLTNFATRGPGKSGEWQTWRMRTRLHDSAASRPWSAWLPFNIVVPMTYEIRPGGVSLPGADLAGGAKRAPASPPASAVQPGAPANPGGMGPATGIVQPNPGALTPGKLKSIRESPQQ